MGGILTSYTPVYSQITFPYAISCFDHTATIPAMVATYCLSDPMVKSWFPDVATSINGSVHVVWASTSQSGAAVLMQLFRHKRGGSQWI
jgi:hypothetical protein